MTPEPVAGQLDSDVWRVTGLNDNTNPAYGGTYTSGDFARGTSSGGVSTGGVYAFDVGGGNIALGMQPGGNDFTPGAFELRIADEVEPVVCLTVSYDLFVLNNAPRSNSFVLEYSTDGTDWVEVTETYFVSEEAADPSPEWQETNFGPIEIDFSSPVAVGEYVYLRWMGDEGGGSGARDEFALDNVSVETCESTAVTIALFEAVPQPDGILLTWVTLEEIDTLGFNLYRATDPAAPETQLNEIMIEPKGVWVGASYEWLDDTAEPGVTYFYWLEDVDYNGIATQHGPISATMAPPSAVTLDALGASAALPPVGRLAAALLVLGAALALRRRA